MNKQSVIELLKLFNRNDYIINEKDGKGWVQFSCIFPHRHTKGWDSKPSAGISFSDNDISTYNCFSCGTKGSLSSIIKQLEYDKPETDFTEIRQFILENEHKTISAYGRHKLKNIPTISAKNLFPPVDQTLLKQTNEIKKISEVINPSSKLLPHLYKRLVPDMNKISKLVTQYQLYETALTELFMQFYDIRGILRGYVLYNPNADDKYMYPKSMKQTFYVGENLIKNNKDYEVIIITEGIFDMFKVSLFFQDGKYPKSILPFANLGVNSSIPQLTKLQFIYNYLHKPKIIYMFDPDNAGISAMTQLKHSLYHRSKLMYNDTYFLNLKDYAIDTDPADMSFKDYHNIFYSQEILSFIETPFIDETPHIFSY